MNIRSGLLLGAAAVSVVIVPGAARAQSLRPNILVIFDTSGSMLRSQTDDGSPLCGGSRDARAASTT